MSFKVWFFIGLLCVSSVVVAGEYYDEKGMKLYKRLCASCHGSPDYGAAQLEQSEWEDLFFMHSAKLLQAHAKDRKLYARLKRESGKKRFSHLQNYLVENAKDTGNVGGCDGNRCGYSSGAVPMKHAE